MTENDIRTAIESMEFYVNSAIFQKKQGKKSMADYFEGAASAINDLMCRTGNGKSVEKLMERLNGEINQ